MPKTSYLEIKTYASNYSNGLAEEETLAVFMPIKDVLELIRRAGTNATQLVGIMSKESNTEPLTISLLCADDNNSILEEHKSGTLDGEETWGTKKTVAQFSEIFT